MPDVALVKGFYRRPLRLETPDEESLDHGGGRVTELLARPLLAALRPELSGVVQPLGGEYAATRELLESVPFAPGYGVEIGLLLDTHARLGLAGLAQVNLGVRKHRNRSLLQLGAMARQILGAALRRCAGGARWTPAPRSRSSSRSVASGCRRRCRSRRPSDPRCGSFSATRCTDRPPLVVGSPVGTALIYLLVVVAVAAAVFGLAAAVFGRGEELAPLAPGATPTRLPVGDVAGEDVRALRFPQAVRGYRMGEVDWVLERLADELDRTARERDELRARVTELEGAAGPGPPPRPRSDAERAAGADPMTRGRSCRCRSRSTPRPRPSGPTSPTGSARASGCSAPGCG